jgi:hypothetical protein
MTDLMNRTYQYKNARDYVGSGGTVQPANFPFPTYQYLSGFNLIDPDHLERSKAYVEVANTHGIRAVQDMQKLIHSGVSLEECLKRYPIPQEEAKAPCPEVSREEAPKKMTERYPPRAQRQESQNAHEAPG